jgi:hypothetical protein
MSGPACPLTVGGLSDGTSYTFTVTASNRAGTGPASAASNLVTPEQAIPAAPAGLAGHFDHDGSLLLSWQAPAAPVDHYQLLLNGSPFERVQGGATSSVVRAFEPKGQSVFTLRAVGATGGLSAASNPITTVPAARPTTAPAPIPGWAWKLLTWQQHADKGERPAIPDSLPRWYAAWKTWRQAPFKLAS